MGQSRARRGERATFLSRMCCSAATSRKSRRSWPVMLPRLRSERAICFLQDADTAACFPYSQCLLLLSMFVCVPACLCKMLIQLHSTACFPYSQCLPLLSLFVFVPCVSS